MAETTVKDGGAAFPLSRYRAITSSGDVVSLIDEQNGMSLRDYFAAQVVGAYLYERFSGNHTWEPHEIAAWSYELADAMLQAREA